MTPQTSPDSPRVNLAQLHPYTSQELPTKDLPWASPLDGDERRQPCPVVSEATDLVIDCDRAGSHGEAKPWSPRRQTRAGTPRLVRRELRWSGGPLRTPAPARGPPSS